MDVRTVPPRSVMMIGNFLSSKGFSRSFVEELAERLAAIGWDCTHASDVVWRPARLADMLYTALRNVRHVSVVHVPVFSGRAFFWAAAVGRIARTFRAPLVLSLHGGNLPAFSKERPDAVRRLLKAATIVVAPSAYLCNALHTFRSDIRHMPNPIALEHYDFSDRVAGAPRLIWLRAFHSIYNPTLAPRMLAILRQHHPDVRLTMIGADKGDGTLQATRRLAKDLGVAEHIDFIGVVPKRDVPRWLQQGTIFINTADVDNTPVSVLEAMASGLPVVSTNVGGIPYLLEDGRNALLVPPGDPAAFAGAVSRLLDAPELFRTIAHAARAKVEEFDWRSIIRRWDELLLEAASRHAGRRQSART